MSWHTLVAQARDLATRYKLGTLTPEELKALHNTILQIEKSLKITEHPERPEIVRLDFARCKAESLIKLGL